jgi:hypothetical protein
MDLLTFFASQPPEALVEGAQLTIEFKDGSTQVVTLGKREPTDLASLTFGIG